MLAATGCAESDDGGDTSESAGDGDGDGDGSGDGDGDGDGDGENCSPDGTAIVELINAYRVDNGKPEVALSPSLCSVALAHVEDLDINAPHEEPGDCNLHSWSDQGAWGACCYTPDHAEAQCMWDKPSELTAYSGYGYENAAAGTNSPADAVEAWKGSPGHNDVMLNQGGWANLPWGAIGAALQDGYAVVWFGEEADPGR